MPAFNLQNTKNNFRVNALPAALASKYLINENVSLCLLAFKLRMTTNIDRQVSQRQRNVWRLSDVLDHFVPVVLKCAGEESTDQALHVVTVECVIAVAGLAGMRHHTAYKQKHKPRPWQQQQQQQWWQWQQQWKQQQQQQQQQNQQQQQQQQKTTTTTTTTKCFISFNVSSASGKNSLILKKKMSSHQRKTAL